MIIAVITTLSILYLVPTYETVTYTYVDDAGQIETERIKNAYSMKMMGLDQEINSFFGKSVVTSYHFFTPDEVTKYGGMKYETDTRKQVNIVKEFAEAIRTKMDKILNEEIDAAKYRLNHSNLSMDEKQEAIKQITHIQNEMIRLHNHLIDQLISSTP